MIACAPEPLDPEVGHRPRGRAVWLVALGLAYGAMLVRVLFQTGALTFPLDAGVACPDRPRHAHPASFHFVPGLKQHQSWIEVQIPEADATDFVLCLDGLLMATGVGETPADGIVDVSVRTTWVDLQRVLGALDRFLTPDRWDVGYTTYTLLQQQT